MKPEIALKRLDNALDIYLKAYEDFIAAEKDPSTLGKGAVTDIIRYALILTLASPCYYN